MSEGMIMRRYGPRKATNNAEPEQEGEWFGISGRLPSASSISNAFITGSTALTTIFQNAEEVTINAGTVTAFNGNALHASTVSLPKTTVVGSSAFQNCTNYLKNVYCPEATRIESSAFRNCYVLSSIYLPSCETIQSSAFVNCSNLSSIDLPACETIQTNAFYGCSNLGNIKLGHSSCVLEHSGAFYETRFTASTSASSGASILVPSANISAYKADPKWSRFSAFITGY